MKQRNINKIKTAYNKWAETYDKVENPTRDLDSEVLRNFIGDISGKIVVEAGCGTGKNTVWLSQHAAKVRSFDFSEKMLKLARKKITAENVNFSQADITKKWLFENESCGVVTINLVLEHIKNIDFVFAEAFRILRSGGILIVCEYHPQKQKLGKKAEYHDASLNRMVTIDAFVHSESEFKEAGLKAGFLSIEFYDWYDENDKLSPRLISIKMKKK